MDGPRFDDLAQTLATSTHRRRFLQGIAALGIGGAVWRSATGRVAARPRLGSCGPVSCPDGYAEVCRFHADGRCIGCICTAPPSSGIAGGGLVRTDAGEEAHLSLFASRRPDPDDPTAFLVFGHVRWVSPLWEGVGLSMESLQITGYGPTDSVEGGRDVAGWLRLNVVDAVVPFLLQVVDAGSAAAGQDTASLWVGDAVPAEVVDAVTPAASGFSYTARGALVSGDLTLLSLGLGGEVVPTTPTP